jgi:very-short-patch-repair endonuclease
MNKEDASPSPSGRGARGEQPRVKIALPAELQTFARKLREQQTDPESLLWLLLRDRRLLGIKFRRQHPVPPYVLDFYSEGLKLAVELDGGQHNEGAEQARDQRRDAHLVSLGVEVARYWNHDVLNRTEEVLEDLMARAALKVRPSPGAARHPLPEGEGIDHPSPSGRGAGGEGPRSHRAQKVSP